MRSATVVTRFICGAAFLWTLAWASPAHAQLGVGEWVRTDKEGGGMTMTVAACCKGGFRLTYHVPIANGQPPLILTVDLPMDGTEVATLSAGKPTGQTMSAKRVDDHHFTGVVKQNGKLSLSNTATLSADGKTLTVEDTIAGGNLKVTEIWTKK
jgi:sugar lactone lactonase YvrE